MTLLEVAYALEALAFTVPIDQRADWFDVVGDAFEVAGDEHAAAQRHVWANIAREMLSVGDEHARNEAEESCTS